jgi:hypothetical protein
MVAWVVPAGWEAAQEADTEEGLVAVPDTAEVQALEAQAEVKAKVGLATVEWEGLRLQRVKRNRPK